MISSRRPRVSIMKDLTQPMFERLRSSDPDDLNRLTWDLLNSLDGDTIEASLLEHITESGNSCYRHLLALMFLGQHRGYLGEPAIERILRLAHANENVIGETAVRALLGFEYWNLSSQGYMQLHAFCREILLSWYWTQTCHNYASGIAGFLEARVKSLEDLESDRLLVPEKWVEELVSPRSGDKPSFRELGYDRRPDSLRDLIAYSSILRRGHVAEFGVSGLNGRNGRIQVLWEGQEGGRLLASSASLELMSHW